MANSSCDTSRNHQFDIVIGAYYKKYFYHPKLDSSKNFLTLTPDTEANFEMHVANFKINVYDKLSFDASPIDAVLPQSNGTFNYDITQYSRFLNTAGIDIAWVGKKTTITGGFNREDLVPIEDEFRFTRYTEYNFPLAIRYQISRDVEIGLKSRYSTRHFKHNTNGFKNNDGQAYELKGGLTWQVTGRLRLDSHAGLIRHTFNQTGTSGDTTDRSSIIYGISAEHQPNRRFKHEAFVSRSADFGSSFHVLEATTFAYDYEWRFMQKVMMRGGALHRTTRTTGVSTLRNNRTRGSIGFAYNPNSKIMVSFDYHYLTNTANFVQENYTQNRFELVFAYDF